MITKYDSHIEPNLEVIQGWLRNGCTEESVAVSLGVGYRTWKRYKSQHDDFRDAIREARKPIVALAVNSAIKQMQGYYVDEQETELHETGQKDKKGEPIFRRVIKKRSRYIPPSLGATCLILFNWDPEHWKDKREIKHSGEIGHTGVLLTEAPMENTDEWEKYVSKLKTEAGVEPVEQASEAASQKSSGRLSPGANRLS